MKRVLVTGASGEIGLKVIEMLLNKTNYLVRVFSLPDRFSKRRLKRYSKQIEFAWGDITKKDQIQKAVKDCQAVIHLAAILPPLSDEEPELAHRVNVEGTKNLVDVLVKENHKGFFLFASSVAIYGDRLDNHWIRVNDPLLPSELDIYAQTKIDAENLIQKSRLNWTIFRLSAIMSENRKLDPLFFHMPLDTEIEVTSTRDTAYAMVQALDHQEELAQGIFNLGGGPCCRATYREFLRENFERMGIDFSLVPEKAFAERNFHCGYYADSNELESILHFQRDCIRDLYARMEEKVPPPQRFFSRIFQRIIVSELVKRSAPWKARKEMASSVAKRFFKSVAKKDSK
ncbi:NAD(P)-dependent oxidoreductase [Gottschalkiaceae bacterium SANA]|nr:NAD(P)-dependent oxidoreductase [Gottschalkiaceae bacterium SANA]